MEEKKKNIVPGEVELNEQDLEQVSGGMSLIGDRYTCARCGKGLLSNSNKYNGKTYCSSCLSIVKK